MQLISDCGRQVDFRLLTGYGIDDQNRIDDRFIVDRDVLSARAEVKINIVLSEITLAGNFGVDRSGDEKTVAIALAEFFDVIKRQTGHFCAEVVIRRFGIYSAINIKLACAVSHRKIVE